MTELDRRHHITSEVASPEPTVDPAPERLQRRLAPAASEPPRSAPVTLLSPSFAIQLFADAVTVGVHATENVQRAAAHGLSGSSSPLPHLGAI